MAAADSTEASAQSGQADAGFRLDSVLTQTREQYELPAMAAVVVQSDSVVSVAALGVRRAGHSDPVTTADRFHIGSNGKAMASTIVAKLVEEGVLAWDTRPIDLFPELGRSIGAGFRGITLQQLLGHRAGLPAYLAEKSIKSAQRRVDASHTPREQRRAFAIWLLQQAQKSAADTDHYSNVGYTIAAAMAEAAADESWESLLASRLARPLGIDLWLGQPARTDRSQPWGHRPKSYFGLGHAGQHEADPEDSFEMGPLLSPAGDIALSPSDYGAFLKQHLAGLKGRDGLLQASSVHYLHFGPGDYALGWGKSSLDEMLAHTHLGSEGTFTAAVMLLPQQDLAAAVFVNSATPDARKAATEATKAILRLYLRTSVGSIPAS
jgi:D-alanyl-D-alanine carboxypeptidase